MNEHIKLSAASLALGNWEHFWMVAEISKWCREKEDDPKTTLSKFVVLIHMQQPYLQFHEKVVFTCALHETNFEPFFSWFIYHALTASFLPESASTYVLICRMLFWLNDGIATTGSFNCFEIKKNPKVNTMLMSFMCWS